MKVHVSYALREWIAVALTEEGVLREMARCLGEGTLAELGRVPGRGASAPRPRPGDLDD